MAKDGSFAAQDLASIFERAERQAEEIKNAQLDLKDIFGEAKAKGFDVGTIKDVLKLRKMTPDDRRYKLSMIEVYMAAVGLGEASLSDMARNFLAGRGGSEPDDLDQDEAANAVPGQMARNATGGQMATDDMEPAPPPLTVDDAKRLGADAQKAGRPVTANPFPAGDPRRLAWDESWCGSAGSDGMAIPEFLMGETALEKKRKDDAKREAEEAAARAAEGAKRAEILGERYGEAKRLVLQHQNASVSWLQRQMPCSHSQAVVAMDALEAEGVVSAPDLQGRRTVLHPKPEGGDDAE